MLSNIHRLDSLSQLIDVNVVLILVAVRVLIQGLVRFLPDPFPQLFVCPRTKQGVLW